MRMAYVLSNSHDGAWCACGQDWLGASKAMLPVSLWVELFNSHKDVTGVAAAVKDWCRLPNAKVEVMQGCDNRLTCQLNWPLPMLVVPMWSYSLCDGVAAVISEALSIREWVVIVNSFSVFFMCCWWWVAWLCSEAVVGVDSVFVGWKEVLLRLFVVAKCLSVWVLVKEACTVTAAWHANRPWSLALVSLA